MTIHTLVLGGNGYLGRHLVSHLVEAGDEVEGFVRSQDGAQVVARRGGRALVGSLDDEALLAEAVKRADTVIWAAQLMLEDERAMVARLLALMANTGKTFVFTSGTSLLSQFTHGAWSEETYAEDDPFVPRRQIAGRLETETLVRAASGPALRTICVRPPLIWGNDPIKVIADFYHSARRNGVVCHLGSGLGCYSTVHIDDLADLYLHALQSGVGGALYHAVSGEVSFRHLADAVARHLGTTTRSIDLEAAETLWDRFTARIVFGSCSRSRSPRARDELDWKPRPDRLDILSECTADHYAQAQNRGVASWVARAG